MRLTRRRSILISVLILVAAQLFLIVHRAAADDTSTPRRAATTVDYGSGQLGAWQTMSHGVIGDPATADVLLIGDSITARCYDTLKADLAAQGKTLAVNYWSGRPTTPAVDWLVSFTVFPPGEILMATGTNDIFDPPVMAGQVTRVLDRLYPGQRLRWVDVQAARTSQTAAVQLADQRNSGWINAQLRSVLAPDQVINWSGVLAATPGRGVSINYYLPDGVHPSDTTGCDLWSYVVRGGL